MFLSKNILIIIIVLIDVVSSCDFKFFENNLNTTCNKCNGTKCNCNTAYTSFNSDQYNVSMYSGQYSSDFSFVSNPPIKPLQIISVTHDPYSSFFNDYPLTINTTEKGIEVCVFSQLNYDKLIGCGINGFESQHVQVMIGFSNITTVALWDSGWCSVTMVFDREIVEHIFIHYGVKYWGKNGLFYFDYDDCL